MKVLKLKNGSEEAEVAVQVLYAILCDMWDKEPIVAYELVMKARNANHEIFGGPSGPIATNLITRNLLQPDGRLHDVTKNIVVSAAEGEGASMTLSWPGVGEAKEADLQHVGETLAFLGREENEISPFCECKSNCNKHLPITLLQFAELAGEGRYVVLPSCVTPDDIVLEHRDDLGVEVVKEGV